MISVRVAIFQINVDFSALVMNVLRRIIITITLCLSFFVVFSQTYTLSGVVKDASTGNSLCGVSVAILGTNNGVFSTTNGSYSIQLSKGIYKVEYSYLGYEDKVVEVKLTDNIVKNIKLSSSAINIQNVVVTARAKDENVSSFDVGLQKIDIAELKLVPVLFGENDVLKTIQLLPGVKSAGEGGSGYFVRGGGADQNLILLDGAPVYSASHMMGMFSVFNGDAIKDAKLYKGSLSAEYGGRLSSVMDVKMREGNLEHLKGQGGIGLISSRIELDGPIGEKSSYMISGRRTYADLFLKMSRKEDLRDTKLHFYDVNYKFTHLFDEKNKLSFSGYLGDDVFGYSDMIGLQSGNKTITLDFLHLAPKTKMKTSAVFSHFNSDIYVELESRKLELESGMTDVNLMQDFESRFKKMTLRYGVNTAFHRFSPGTFSASMLESAIVLEKRNAAEANVYIDNSHTLTEYLKVEYGVRFSNYFLFGKGDFYVYNGEHEVVDTNSYRSGELVEFYPNIEPRVSFNFRLNQESSIKAAYTRTVQPIHLIQSSTISLPIDYWMPSSQNTKPQTCSQISLGYFKNFKENSFETSVEVYYKNMRHQVDYESGTNLMLNENLAAYLLYGECRSYGIELFAKKCVGDFTGWISYTLSKTERLFDEINEGAWYPLRYDRTHDISIVLMYVLNKKWNFSATWVYSTGDAVTFPMGKYKIDGETVAYYTERNTYRMPAYHRLDLGVVLHPQKQRKWENFDSEWSFSIYNVYNRKNAYMVYFEEDEGDADVLHAMKMTLFPIIPSVSWNFSF